MSIQNIPFSKPFIGEEEVTEVVDTLRNGWLTSGPKVKQFESDFARYLGGDVHCVSVNSATAGLHLALEALNVGPGDEVIVPSYTFTATAEVVRYLGAEVRFVDIDARTLNIDPFQIEQTLSPNTKAIIAVHLAGYPAEMSKIEKLGQKHGIPVVEDAAHALGTEYHGQRIGRLTSSATVFSFYATKCITTGEGGMVVTADASIADRCRKMRLHGIDRDAFDRYRVPGASWYYEIIAPGFKYNLTDIAAALGIAQLRRADFLASEREKLARCYMGGLEGLPLKLPAVPEGNHKHSWHLFIVQLLPDAPLNRDQLIALLASRGIQCSVHFIPLHMQPYWRDRYKLKEDDLPVSKEAYSHALSLPLFPGLTSEEQDYIISCLKEALLQ